MRKLSKLSKLRYSSAPAKLSLFSWSLSSAQVFQKGSMLSSAQLIYFFQNLHLSSAFNDFPSVHHFLYFYAYFNVKT